MRNQSCQWKKQADSVCKWTSQLSLTTDDFFYYLEVYEGGLQVWHEKSLKIAASEKGIRMAFPYLGRLFEPMSKKMTRFARFCCEKLNMNKEKLPAPYRWLKSYIRLMVEKVYYRQTFYLNKEQVLADGTPLLIVSDHQNSLNDALGILLSICDRMVHFIVRADVFALSPLADKFLRSIGLLPAFRLNWEGEQALSSNGATFRDSEKALLDGSTVVIYPEAGHQDKHWLGTFSYGYTKMAFDAAEMGGFEKEVFILPSCNHYSGYRGLRTDMLIKYGTPISLKPYYELYRTKPRMAQRKVNALVREQIKGMMLSIDDVENYEAIDYIRQSSYGRGFAKSTGLDPDNLPQKLDSDKRLVAALAEAKAAAHDKVNAVYSDVKSFISDTRASGLDDSVIDHNMSKGEMLTEAAVMLLLLPLAVFALWPSAFCWLIPKHFSDKAEDKMFSGTFLIALNVLFLFPVFGLITFIVTWMKASLVAAVLYVALIPLLCLFEWTYAGWIRELVQNVRAQKAEKTGVLESLRRRKAALYKSIDTILGR